MSARKSLCILCSTVRCIIIGSGKSVKKSSVKLIDINFEALNLF